MVIQQSCVVHPLRSIVAEATPTGSRPVGATLGPAPPDAGSVAIGGFPLLSLLRSMFDVPLPLLTADWLLPPCGSIFNSDQMLVWVGWPIDPVVRLIHPLRSVVAGATPTGSRPVGSTSVAISSKRPET